MSTRRVRPSPRLLLSFLNASSSLEALLVNPKILNYVLFLPSGSSPFPTAEDKPTTSFVGRISLRDGFTTDLNSLRLQSSEKTSLLIALLFDISSLVGEMGEVGLRTNVSTDTFDSTRSLLELLLFLHHSLLTPLV